jgi:uncharacterized protein (DUF58 family)
MIRRFQLIVIAAILLIAAFSTQLEFLFYLVYLSILVIGGSYILTRLGLADLEAGYAVNQLTGHVGDKLQITYTLRNTSRVPKPWLEVHNPTTLPGGLPGRAISLGSRAERSWLVRAPLTRRGHFRVEPLQIRTGDPFGFFEASASVGQGVAVVVYPRIERLPLWRLPAANIEGSHAAPERTLQTSPLATAVRPYAPGDAFNRIHWKSTARHGEIQVKEFELEQTADAWIFLDLERSVQGGRGEESTVELAVRAAASIAAKALLENRAVGLTVNGHRQAIVPVDRGSRQHLKIMQLLAAVEGDGTTPLAECLVSAAGRLRRGMTAIVITASTDPGWVRPIAALRARGIGSVVVTADADAADRHDRAERTRLGERVPEPDPATADQRAKRARALRHALAEYELAVHTLTPGRSISETLGA